jgi:hypothetical protein
MALKLMQKFCLIIKAVFDSVHVVFVSPRSLDCLTLKMGQIVCPETSVNNYRLKLCNNSEK